MKAFVDLQLVHSMVMNHNAPKTARHSIADALMELPRIELDSDHDLVSRKAVMAELVAWRTDSRTCHDVVADIADIPAPPTPAPDRVLASDVVEGVEFFDGYYWQKVKGVSGWGTTSLVTIVYRDNRLDDHSFDARAVADMLQGCLDRGERVDWPDGSPGCRFRKEEAEPPTLLEVLEFVYSDIKNEPGVGYRAKDMALAAIEREKAKQGEGR